MIVFTKEFRTMDLVFGRDYEAKGFIRGITFLDYFLWLSEVWSSQKAKSVIWSRCPRNLAANPVVLQICPIRG